MKWYLFREKSIYRLSATWDEENKLERMCFYDAPVYATL